MVAALAAGGQMVYLAHAAITVHDPFAFVHAESHSLWQGDANLLERILKVNYFRLVPTSSDVRSSQVKVFGFQALGLLAVIACVVMILKVPAILPRPYLLFAVLGVFPFAGGVSSFLSSGRFMLQAFPTFLAAGSLTSRLPRRRRSVLLAGSFVLQLCLAMALSRGNFVG